MNEISICKLCSRERKVIRSHLIPRAIYRLLGQPGSDPVHVSSDAVIQSSRQITAYLLCRDCDGGLNKHGETWLIPLLARRDGEFPLYDILQNVPPEIDSPTLKVYSAVKNPGIHVDRLLHFAMGIFWKASVHSWRGRKNEPLIHLGKYKEPLRRFVRREGPFPSNMTLTATVLPKPVRVIASNVPYGGPHDGCHKYIFCVPGIAFALHVGNQIPTPVRDTCCASNPSRPIVLADLSFQLLSLAADVAAPARTSRKLQSL